MEHNHEYSEQYGKWVCDCGRTLPTQLMGFPKDVEIAKKILVDFIEHKEE